ncbi:palmitoleoyl- carboxylesterase notum1 -like, partial [Paramuricea clavata]
MFLRGILAVTIISFGIFRLGDSRSNTMYKQTLLNKGALCNDGSRAVYYLGLQKTSKWIIFLESGAYCLTKTQCLKRFGNDYSNVLMTSKHMPNTIGGRDLLSTSPNENELFNDNSRVLIPYCTSDAWLGTQTKASSFKNNRTVEEFVFSGKIVFESVIFELLNKGLSKARQVVLIGTSAGAVGVFNLVQWLQDLFSSKRLYVSISVIIDGGWFINFQESITSAVVEEFYVIGKPLSRACADSTYGYPCCLSASCMLARGYYPSNVPTIFLFSMYDIYIIRDIVTRLSGRVSVAENGATDLLTAIDSYGGAMNQSLFAIKPGSSNLSYFVPACFQHTFFSMSSLRDQGGMLHYSKVFTQGNAMFG